MKAKPPPLTPRVCARCGQTYQPRRADQKCCGRKCRNRLSHHPAASTRIIHAEMSGGENTWIFSAVLGGYSVRGFLFDASTGFVIWPKDKAGKPIFLSGPAWWLDNKGIGAVSKLLARLMRNWIDNHVIRKPAPITIEPELPQTQSKPEPITSQVIYKSVRPRSPCCRAVSTVVGGDDLGAILQCSQCQKQFGIRVAVWPE